MTLPKRTTVAVGMVAAVLATGAAPLASAKINYGGVKVRQAGGADERVFATFTSAKCNRLGRGFGAFAKTANGRYRLSVDISAQVWKGFSHHYNLPRRAGQFVSQVRVTAPGGTVYDSTEPVPGGTGGGGISFTPKGDAISIGGVFFLEGDTEVGIAVSGAMNCVYAKKVAPKPKK